MSYHSELDAELRGLHKLPADVLTMPAVPWIDLDEDDSYAWYASLAGAIARARELGRTTELRGPDGEPVAVIAPPPPKPERLLRYWRNGTSSIAAGINYHPGKGWAEISPAEYEHLIGPQ